MPERSRWTPALLAATALTVGMLSGCGTSPTPRAEAAPAPVVTGNAADEAFIHVLRSDDLLPVDTPVSNQSTVNLGHAVCNYLATTHSMPGAITTLVGGGSSDAPWTEQQATDFVAVSTVVYCPQEEAR